ncbi:MAG: DoxX family protein [Candidatus Aenigmarchaeota archaeon]|nr:DoxX family protein [Candidatus Aenigmarchaeota archaeon]
MALDFLSMYNDMGIFLLRFAVGFIFLYHSIPKLQKPGNLAKGLGTESMFIPTSIGFLEFSGGMAIITGAFVRYASFVLAFVMLVALFYKISKWKTPFSSHEKTGWEFDFILFFASIFLLVNGGGSIGLGI